MTFPCIKNKIHKYTNTKIRKYINTKSFKDPTCAIFLKGMGFNYINYDIPVYSRMSIIIIISYHQKYKVLCIFLHFSALLCTSLHLSAFLMQFFAFLCIFLYISTFLRVAQSAVAQQRRYTKILVLDKNLDPQHTLFYRKIVFVAS